MKAVFIELPYFSRYRADFFDDEHYADFQNELMDNPEKGDLIQGTGGLRKIRVADPKRQKGKRGGARVIYYWYLGQSQFFLFTVYGKNQQDDLSHEQRQVLAQLLQTIKDNQT